MWVETSTGAKHQVNELLSGSYFGEISLLQGIPRMATVKTTEEMTCFKLTKKYVSEALF